MTRDDVAKNFSGGEPSGKSNGNSSGKVVWRDIAMTDTVMDRIDRQLSDRSRGRERARAMARFASAGIDLGGLDSPAAMAPRCGDPEPREWADRTLSVLCDMAPRDEEAALVVLVALGPHLRKMARRLVVAGLSADDAGSVVVLSALAAMGDAPHPAGEDGVAVTLLAGTWRRCRKELRRSGRALRTEVPGEPTREGEATPGTSGPDHDDPVLDRALRTGVLTLDQAALLYETRGLDRPLSAVSREWGRPRGQLASSRRRAETRLREMLRAEAEEDGSGEGARCR